MDGAQVVRVEVDEDGDGSRPLGIPPARPRMGAAVRAGPDKTIERIERSTAMTARCRAGSISTTTARWLVSRKTRRQWQGG
jgi:hypothetical protein